MDESLKIANNMILLEIGEFYAWCWATEEHDGWQSWVQFERKDDYRNDLITGKKHRIHPRIDAEQNAMMIATDFAHQCVKNNQTGF